MAQMLGAVLDYLHNDFRRDRFHGYFEVNGGTITQAPEGFEPPDGAHIRIFGSYFNDGVHVIGDDDLSDETWVGNVWVLAIPTELLNVVADIETSLANSTTASSAAPMKSESFDGYSYTRATRADGSLMDWRDAYHDRLERWRKL